jgi:beta-alanine--pyruvate transaminase
LAALEIYEREHLFERAAEMSDSFLDRIFSLADIPIVTDIRGYGMLAGFDLAPAEMPGARGVDALKRLYDAGLLIKLTGDTVIIAPPLVASATDLDQIGDILRRVLMRL